MKKTLTLTLAAIAAIASAGLLTWDSPEQPAGTTFRAFASEDLTNWVEIGVVPYVSGVSNYSLPLGPTDKPQEFYKLCAEADGFRAWCGGLIEEIE